MYKFFISCPLDLEKQVQSELISKWSFYIDSELPKLNIINSGIELETELSDGMALNHILRSPNRILLRLKEQKCRDLPKLFKIISKIEWKLYLKKETANFKISCSESRLMHTKRIEDSCTDGLKKYFHANKIKAKVVEEYKDSDPANIYLRLDNDNLTISIDTTGELLYKRDEVNFKGKAPLRNNLAYIMHEFLIDNSIKETSEYTLIDPMCGSGTFLHEAKNRTQPNLRSFAYEVFNEKVTLKEIDSKNDYKDFLGFDIDKENISKLKDKFTIKNEDLFKDSKEKIESKNLCIINPPYGKKIKIKGVKTNKERQAYFEKIISRCFEKFNSEYVGIIIPDDIRLKRKTIKSLKVFNNGIRINFNIYKKSNRI